jgi:glycosyltransferase involved in cell wall biosynthesis
VDVVVGNPLDSYAPPRERGVKLVAASSFRAIERLRQPDRIIYCMGNSAFHRYVYELLRERPGAMVAHDVRLTGFYGWFSAQENPDDPAGRAKERIEALYGTRLPPAAIAAGMPSWEQQAALGIYMTREIQQYAEQIFVHSRHALEVLELDRGPLDRQVPVSVLPFGMPPASKHPYRAPGGSPLIVSVGVISEIKGLANLITAVSLVAKECSGVRLVIAGPGDGAELRRWRDLAREVAPAADIQVSGHLSDTRYTQLLRDADIAVQLRTLSNGEASAAVADCLAAGIPTVVSDLGWASELPADAVLHVPADCVPTRLADRLEHLIKNREAHRELHLRALAYAREHSFSAVAQEYLHLLEIL